jgi:hypothetical protein
VRVHRVALWVASVTAAVLAGAFGDWMVAWAIGDTVSVQVDNCYLYYGRTETVHFRCEGYWRITPADRSPDSVRGPVVGVRVDPHAALVDPKNQAQFGYEVVFPPHRYLATLNGDAAIVIPTSHLVLGPVGALGTVASGVALLVVSFRSRD